MLYEGSGDGRTIAIRGRGGTYVEFIMEEGIGRCESLRGSYVASPHHLEFSLHI